MNVATMLVEIAEDLFVFGSVTAQTSHHHHGDPEPVVHTFASPKGNPEIKRPLADIRPDLAEVYQATYGSVPSATSLGNAMTVLEGKARKATPIQADEATLASLLGGASNIATKLVEIAHEQYDFGVTTTGEAYAVPTDGPNVARVLHGGRRSLRSELARIYFEKTKAAANAQALADALLVLEGEAQGTDPSEVALRVGRSPLDDGRLVLDLGGDDGRAVVIGAYGWEIVEHSPVLFWRTNATLPLPTPDDLGSLDDLRSMLNVRDEDWPLIVAWLVAALIPELPHPVLLLRGEHGTAKSSAARLVTSLVDRCASQLRTAPRNVEDWAVACAGSWITCLDNLSDIQDWLQDAVCRAVTGDGLLRRQLYTDSDVSVLAFRRVVALTSIDPGRLNGDLADRLLTVELERIPESARAAEEAMTQKWTSVHAGVLGGLLHTTVNVLRALGPIRQTNLPRMADFARILLAVDEVLGTDAYTTYSEQASRTAETVAEGDSVAIAIRENITDPWEGTASDLLKLLTVEKPPRDWPSTPQGMGGRLARAAPSLRALGWSVEPPDRTRRERHWYITPPPSEEYPAGMAPMAQTC
ncbi:MAG: ATP-binding protein [Jiangellaceae bacterium]